MTDVAKQYAVYDRSTGQILRYGICTEGLQELQLDDTETQILIDEAISDAVYFIFEGRITERPTIPLAQEYALTVGIGELTIGVPATTVVRIGDDEYVVDDGSFTFSSDETGEFDIKVEPPFPWVPVDTRVTVT